VITGSGTVFLMRGELQTDSWKRLPIWASFLFKFLPEIENSLAIYWSNLSGIDRRDYYMEQGGKWVFSREKSCIDIMMVLIYSRKHY
jgi:hypothetical protein